MIDLLSAVAAVGILLIFSGLTVGHSGPNPLIARLDSLIVEAGVNKLDAGRLLALSMGAAVFTFLVVAGITGALVPAGVASAAALAAPFAYVRAARDRRRRRFREAWPDALATMIAGIRAGVSLPEICTSLAEKGPSDLRRAFEAYAAIYRSTGSFVAALARLRMEMSDPIADRVTASLKLAHEVGGTDLVRVLRTLSDFVREDLRIRKEIEARWSWTVTAARVAAASPWIVLLIMSTRPEAAKAYDSPGGGFVVLVGAAATLVGYRLMLRAAQLPEDRRIGG